MKSPQQQRRSQVDFSSPTPFDRQRRDPERPTHCYRALLFAVGGGESAAAPGPQAGSAGIPIQGSAKDKKMAVVRAQYRHLRTIRESIYGK